MARQRSPNYPSMGLGDAIKRLGALWAKEKQTPVTDEVAVKAMGYKGLSGPSRSHLSALKKYGLIEDLGTEVRISERGLKIVRPVSDDERQAAINEAALAPDLFREIRKAYPDASDDSLRARLLREGYSEDGAKRAIAAYRDTAAVAKLDDVEYPGDEDEGNEGERRDRNQERRRSKGSGVIVLNYSVSPDRIVEVSIPGGPLTKSEITTLTQYLEIAKSVAPEQGIDEQSEERAADPEGVDG